MHLFATSARLVKDHPLTGTGAGRFHGAFLRRQTGTVDRAAHWTNAHHAHHDGLHIAAEQGIPAALLFAIPLVLAALRRPWTTWHAMALAGVLLGSVNPLLDMPGACFLFAHAVGAALGPARERSVPSPWPGRLLGLALLGLATHQLMADRLLARADANQDSALAETAARWSLEPARALRVAAAHRPPDGQALAWAEAAEHHDLSVEGVMLRGRILHALGRYDDAARAFEEAVHLNRWLFAGWFNLARVHEDRGDRAAARRAAQRARRLRPTDARLRHLPP
jgi:tetratricopeptide (TPR) repeat protein